MPAGRTRLPRKNSGIPSLADPDLALREKQIQQNYRPIVAVHKWFARRPGTLFRGLLLSEFLDAPLRETFYKGQSLPDLRSLDPFMGGGTTCLGNRKVQVPIDGEWIGDRRNGAGQAETKQVRLERADATAVSFDGMKFDAIFTDPPYFRSVQYAELMDFCYVWLRRLTRANHPEFAPLTTRHANELTGNDNMGRTLEHFTEGMSRVFQMMASALKPGSPLAFTYHHNRLCLLPGRRGNA